jgi:DMSO/TMAO reductase YedYZ molybdopterin-dependent catalytic subunit
MSSMDRREFFRLAGAGITGVMFASVLPGCETHTVAPVNGPVNPGASPLITPVGDFFVQNGGEGDIAGWRMPDVSRESWTLRIRGEVENDLTFRFQDLMDLRDANREVTVLKTMQCILESPLRVTATGYSGNAYWTGVPLRPLLEDRAKIFYDSARRLLLKGSDGFVNNITIARMKERTRPEPLLVYEMNGAPLTREHGAPVRLLLQEDYGYKNIKWLSEIDATVDQRAIGNYQRNGFTDDATIRVTSRSTNLREHITLPAGAVEITGFAVSGAAPIKNMEISLDGGASWNIVALQSYEQFRDELPARGAGIAQVDNASQSDYPFLGVWVKWSYLWENAGRGSYDVAIRATDAAGNIQPLQDVSIADGQTGVAHYRVTLT